MLEQRDQKVVHVAAEWGREEEEWVQATKVDSALILIFVQRQY